MTTTAPHTAFNVMTPDEVAECIDGIYSFGNLYETLWSCVPDYTDFDREDCGPHDVIGLNTVAQFWDRFTEEQRIHLNACIEAHDAKLEAWSTTSRVEPLLDRG